MQPSNPLILLGIAMIASNAIGVSAAAAEPGMHHLQASAAEGEATSASSTSTAAPTTSVTDSASPPSEPTPEAANTEHPAWQSSLKKAEVLKAQISGEEQLDRLQRDSFNRQRRSESQNNSFDRPLAPPSDPLRIEQDIQRQINLPSSSDSTRLEQVQESQRLRQQLRQQNRPPVPDPNQAPNTDETQSQAVVSSDVDTNEVLVATAGESAAAEPAATPAGLAHLRPSKDAAKLQAEVMSSEATSEATAPDVIPTVVEQADAEQAEPSESAVQAPTQDEQTDQPEQTETAQGVEPQAEQQVVDAAVEEPIDAEPASEQTMELPADQDAVEAAQTTPESSPSPESPVLNDAPVPSDPPSLEEADIERRNLIETDTRLFSDDTPAPEYLDPDPNPLAFPTTPDEVEIVGTQPITLKQAVELALRNNAELRQAQLTLERTQAELRETQAINLPTASANAQFNQQGSESASQQPDTDFLGQPNPDAGDITVTYGDSTTLGAGIQLDYTIFTSGRRPALIEAARGQVRLQQLDIERQIEQLIFDVATNYYDLQEAGAQVNIFSANLAQAEQSLRDAQALERAGVGTRFDVLQAEVEVANARQDLTQQLSQLEIARRELAQQVNISESVDIAAADPIEVSGVWDLSLEESIVQAYKNRVELEQSLIQREIAQRNRRAALAQLGPQIGLSGAFNVVNDFDNDFTFLHNYQVGLTLTQSLYDGGVARSQANQQESNIAIAESEFENRREQIRFEVERAYSQLDSNFANIQTTALAVEQAAEALRLARLRFQAGVGTQTDVLRQQTELARSQVNNLSAILSYNRAIVALERAVSNYPEGYLNDAP